MFRGRVVVLGIWFIGLRSFVRNRKSSRVANLLRMRLFRRLVRFVVRRWWCRNWRRSCRVPRNSLMLMVVTWRMLLIRRVILMVRIVGLVVRSLVRLRWVLFCVKSVLRNRVILKVRFRRRRFGRLVLARYRRVGRKRWCRSSLIRRYDKVVALGYCCPLSMRSAAPPLGGCVVL